MQAQHFNQLKNQRRLTPLDFRRTFRPCWPVQMFLVVRFWLELGVLDHYSAAIYPCLQSSQAYHTIYNGYQIIYLYFSITKYEEFLQTFDIKSILLWISSECFSYKSRNLDISQAKETASRGDNEQGICLNSKLNPRLLIAVPVKGSWASVFTRKMNGREWDTTGPANRFPKRCPQYLSFVYIFCKSCNWWNKLYTFGY